MVDEAEKERLRVRRSPAAAIAREDPWLLCSW